jgi:BirA family biotin operon repressor/biotin-[acetyl-CoA-carboxylase] ligase
MGEAVNWRIYHKDVTASTNEDALIGVHGDVFTADFQTAGRGRGEHTWLLEKRCGLAMSVVLDVADLSPEYVATSALVAGLAVAKGVETFGVDARIKWPNDVYANNKKLSGILCRRNGDTIIIGIGVNVKQKSFPDEISSRAISLSMINVDVGIEEVRDAILDKLLFFYEIWKNDGVVDVAHGISLPLLVMDEINKRDMLKGHEISIMQTDDDRKPVYGVCGGISNDGALIVDGKRIYSGEAVKKASVSAEVM